jgi:hypothetical protein
MFSVVGSFGKRIWVIFFTRSAGTWMSLPSVADGRGCRRWFFRLAAIKTPAEKAGARLYSHPAGFSMILAGGNLMRWTMALLAAGLIGAGAASARGEDFFQLSADATSGTPAHVSTGGSNVIDLVNNLIEQESDFATLANRDFTGSLTYGGVKNAALFSANADVTRVTLTLPATGFSKTFTGANQDEVQDQIEDWLKKDGASEYAKFLKAIDQASPVSNVDGNPQATTAFMATQSFKRYGLNSTLSLEPKSAANDNNNTFDFQAGVIQTDVVDGWYTMLDVSGAARFNDHVALSLALPVEYRNYQGSEVVSAGLELGVPVTLVNTHGGGLGWQITPFGFGAGSGSVDLASGGVLYGGGVTNLLSLQLGPFTVAMANQFSYYHGTPVSWGDYRFETDVDQPILKNGGKIAWAPEEGLSIDAGITYTNFLDEAAVDHYWSPTAGVTLRFGKDHASGLRVGYAGDFGPGYTSHGGNVVLYFNY